MTKAVSPPSHPGVRSGYLGVAMAAALVCGAAAQAPGDPGAGDPVRGARLFLQCRACHTVGKGEAGNVGPNLYGVVDAKAASRPGFTYSSALAASGLIWTPANLDAWLTRPTALVPGTKMAFAGVAAPKMRQDIIAYLTTLGGKSVPARP